MSSSNHIKNVALVGVSNQPPQAPAQRTYFSRPVVTQADTWRTPFEHWEAYRDRHHP